MTFGSWSEDIHSSEPQKKRMLSAASAALTPIEVEHETKSATFSGHHGVYQTTLDSCTCVDFHARQLPCKHIYRLAHEIDRIDLGHTVMYSADAIINPDEEDRTDKAIRIGLVIDEQPKNSYVPILAVLRTIQELGRPLTTINSAIQHLEAKITSENIPTGGLLLTGKIFVLTGDFSSFSRKEAAGWLEDKGAKVSGSLSSKTNYLIMGERGNDGKLQRAQAMDIPVLTEQDFLAMLQK